MKRFDIRLDGFDPDASEVPEDSLGRLFGMTPEAARRLLGSLPRVVKRNVEEQNAARIVGALQGVGARAVLEASPIRPSAVMPVGQAAPNADRDLPDIASAGSAPGHPVAHPTVVRVKPPTSSGTLVLPSVVPAVSAPAAEGASRPAPVAAATTQPEDSGHTAELGPGNDPWAPTSADARSAQTAPLLGGDGTTAPHPQAASMPAQGSQQQPPTEHVAIPDPRPVAPHPPSAERVAIPVPVVPQPAAQSGGDHMALDALPSQRVSIPAPVAAAAAAVASGISDAPIERDPHGAFPGIDLGKSAGVRPNDSMEPSHDPLALPDSDAPPPPQSDAPLLSSLPAPAPVPRVPARKHGPDSPLLAAMPWLVPQPPITDRPAAKAFGLLGVVSVLTLVVYAIFVL